jgi:hypothetical protein
MKGNSSNNKCCNGYFIIAREIFKSLGFLSSHHTKNLFTQINKFGNNVDKIYSCNSCLIYLLLLKFVT